MNLLKKIVCIALLLTTAGISTKPADEKVELITTILAQITHIQNLADNVRKNHSAFDELTAKTVQEFACVLEHNNLSELDIAELKELAIQNENCIEILKDALQKEVQPTVIKKRTKLGSFLVQTREFCKNPYVKEIAKRVHPYALWMVLIAYKTPTYKLERKYPSIFLHIKNLLKRFGMGGIEKMYTIDVGIEDLDEDTKKAPKIAGCIYNEAKIPCNSDWFNEVFAVDMKSPIKLGATAYISSCVIRDLKDLYNLTKTQATKAYDYLTQEEEIIA